MVVTKAGRKRLAQLHGVVHEFDAELRDALPSRDVEVLRRALTRVHEHFSEEVANGRG